MSGAIAGAGGNPALTVLIAGSAAIKRRFDTLTAQASSGLISNTFSGLGASAPAALTLRPRIESLKAAQANIDAASGPAQVTQSAMKRIQGIAANLMAGLPNLNGLNPAGVDTIAASARANLVQVGELLNSQFGGAYVFSGQDTGNPPVPNAEQLLSSGFFAQISGAVAGLSVNGAAVTASTTLTAAASNAPGSSPFSAYMLQGPGTAVLPSVSLGDGQARPIGLLASENVSSVSTGSSTTGSHMRDLMRALATVGSLTSAQAGDANFSGLIADTQTSVTGAIVAMATDVGVLGEHQAALTATQTTLGDMAQVLSAQLSPAENVDMAATLSALTQTQTQLQASYQLISAANAMSLVKFLPAG